MEKYYQYCKQGLFDNRLSKYYSDIEIQIANKYIEENDPSLVLRKIPIVHKNIKNRCNKTHFLAKARFYIIKKRFLISLFLIIDK